ncbi:MAG: PilZ domain-containing protein [Bryobacteraceae bacterium]|nr:PilZ domain-containing protein [Bryobacteraceae bacterium]
MNDQRRSKRFDLKLPVEVIRPHHSPAHLVGETCNISSNGVLFKTDHPVEVGESLEYYVTLPTAPSPTERLRLRCVGKVVRIAPTSLLSFDDYAFGVTMERYEFMRQRVAAKATAL